MTHLWVRAEQRANEDRVGLTPEGAAQLIAAGLSVTVEDSPTRCIPTDHYATAGATIAPAHSWPDAPADAIVFGLKELPEDGSPLHHRHIMFGHAYKGQPAGQVLLQRFKAGGGALYDLEYLVDEQGKRVAAFGYWAGYAGAAVALMCWIAQQKGQIAGPVRAYPNANHMLADLQAALVSTGSHRPTALIIGALGRVGHGGRGGRGGHGAPPAPPARVAGNEEASNSTTIPIPK
ncbi:MAG: hypothetical protein AAFR44_10960, partial [Pseudomonadota bacterium]